MKQRKVLIKAGILLLSLLLVPGLTGCGAVSSLMATPTPTAMPTPAATATPMPTPLPGIPFSKEEAVEVPSISSIVGHGTVHFKPGKETKNLRVEVTGRVPVVNGKSCDFCVDTITIAPNLRVGLKWFGERAVKISGYVVTLLEMDGLVVEGPVDDEDGYIVAGPEGATLTKEGNAFYLVEGEAWLVLP